MYKYQQRGCEIFNSRLEAVRRDYRDDPIVSVHDAS